MDLFRDISKGKFGRNSKLKREAKHELQELGGEKRAERYEKALARMKGRVGSGKSHISGKHYKHD